MKETPLLQEHKKRKAKIIPFAGWKMPLQFTSPQKEHLHVRQHVGLFDVSHMGEISIQGEKALDLLSSLVTNNIANIQNHQSQYNLICNDQGGIIDDLIIYCIRKPSDYLLCVNAVNCDKVFQWICRHNTFTSLKIKNTSEQWGLIAVQGPKSIKLISLVFGSQTIQKFHFDFLSYDNEKLLVSRTGYTGEEGFEIFSPVSILEKLWQEFLSYENSFPIIPVGLAARDTLRLEMKYPLHGQDMNEEITPAEMGLKWVCKNPESFIGKYFCLQKPKRKWIGFEILQPSGIPRSGFLIFSENQTKIGQVTSGAFSPSLQKMIGVGFVQEEFSKKEAPLLISIHGKNIPAQITPTPFVIKNKNSLS